MTRPLAFTLLLLMLAAIPAAAQEPRAEERKQPTVPADGTEVLQYLLDKAKLKPVRADEVWNMGATRDTIVIVLGSTNNLRTGHQPTHLAATVLNNGGASMVASDTSVFLGNFPNANDFNGKSIRIPNGRVSRGARAASLFLPHQSDNMPFVVPLAPRPGLDGPEWELFDGLERIATNRPSFIQAVNPRGEFGSLLASYHDDCRFNDSDTGASGLIDQRRQFFAVGSSGQHLPNRWQRFRFLLLADPSVFINQMMLASDDAGRTDNLEFAARVVAYLAEREDGGRRTRCLLIQNGEVIEDFGTLRGMMQPPLPLPNIMAMQDKLTDFGNKVLDHFQTNDTSNKMLLGTDPEKRERSFLGILKYVVCTLILIRLVWYAMKRTWVARRPADGPPPPTGGLPPQAKKAKPRGLFERREKELIRRNNIYEPVKMIVRDMLLAAAAPEKPGKRLPEVEIADTVKRPDTLVDALTDLWKIAFGPARVVTLQRWKLLEPLLERVRQAHADGKWRFVQH